MDRLETPHQTLAVLLQGSIGKNLGQDMELVIQNRFWSEGRTSKIHTFWAADFHVGSNSIIGTVTGTDMIS